MTDIYDKLDNYGVRYEGEQGEYVESDHFLRLSELAEAGGKVIRVRFVGESLPGRGRCFDLSYVQGLLPDGTRVGISHLPFFTLVPRHKLKGKLIEWARRERVFAKGLGLLEEANWSLSW